jgi:hypothetical protein
MKIRYAAPAVIALALVLAATAQATSPKISYNASGSYETNDCSHQIDCAPTYGYAGSSSCSKNCLSGAPSAGSFAISLTGSSLHPPSPCISKKVQGSVEVTWPDSSTTTASLTGAFNKRKVGYVLKVTVTGGTNTFFAPGPASKGFVSHPPSPCNPGSFAGSLTFSH